MTRIFLSACFFVCFAAAQSAPEDLWKPFRFLLGDWIGEGTGAPGEGRGGFTFSFDLDRKILIRKNFADYPAQGGRPASHHEDLMIVYVDEGSKRPRAIYFDTEGHVIRYTATASEGGLVFESEAGEPGPHYRLSYVPAGDRVKGKFEMRAPGEKEYKTYLDFSVRRQ